MKQKKHLILTLALMAFFGAAQAQITPEAIIGQCPAMPSVATLVADGKPDSRAWETIKIFHEQINSLEERASVEINRINDVARSDANALADRTAQQQTGHSVAELQNMSEASLQAMANNLVAQRMAAMGMGGTKSAAGNPSSMTKAQTEAYLAQGQPNPELKRINDRWAEIDRVNQKEAAETAAKIQEIYARYAPQLAAVPRGEANAHSDALTEAQQKTLGSLADARDTECYTLKRNLISTIQGRIKTKMADVPRYDELRPDSGITMPSHGYNIAALYLVVTASITDGVTDMVRFR